MIFTTPTNRSRVDSIFIKIRNGKDGYQAGRILALFDAIWQGICLKLVKVEIYSIEKDVETGLHKCVAKNKCTVLTQDMLAKPLCTALSEASQLWLLNY